jgi:methyl acetate hydrolase
VIDRARLDEALERGVARGAVPGAVAIVADRDSILYSGAAGPLGAGDDRPMRTDTIFRIASMTKLATTVAVMQLVDDGSLDLETPVEQLVPRFAALEVLDGFAEDGPRLRAPRGKATVRQLLAHTSGLGYAQWNHDLARWAVDTGARPLGSGKLDAFDESPLIDDPGTSFNYSTGHDWAGLVVEQVSGMPLDRFWQERLFGPLGMVDTRVQLDDAGRARATPVHVRTGEGGWLATGIDLFQPGDPDPEFWAGGHCLYSTAADYTRLQQAFLDGGTSKGVAVLRPGTVDEMLRNQIGDIEVPVFPAAEPDATAEVDLGADATWGLGVHIKTRRDPGLRHAGSAGWLGLFNTAFWIDREAGLTVGYYAQTLPFYDRSVIDAIVDFERAVYA